MDRKDKLANLLFPKSKLERGYCYCGCGVKTNPAKRSNAKMGYKRGDPSNYIRGHQRRDQRQAYRLEDRGYRSPCWIWQRQTIQGYASINIDHKNIYVHRAMYEIEQRPLDARERLDHLCRQRACINPLHLEAVSNRENVIRMYVSMIAKALKEELKAGSGVYTDLFALYGLRTEAIND